MSKREIEAKRITCNEEHVYFDGEAWARGKVVLVPETLDEQCENCGENIGESGEIDEDGRGDLMLCGYCGTAYTATDVTMESAS